MPRLPTMMIGRPASSATTRGVRGIADVHVRFDVDAGVDELGARDLDDRSGGVLRVVVIGDDRQE